MNKFLYSIFLLCVLVFLSFFFLKNIAYAPENDTPRFLFENGKEILIEYADTQEKHIHGLSGRESLPENSGLLFLFEREEYYGFWMKDMNFAIDIIWIGKDSRIKDITKNISPETYPRVFKPQDPILYVLEVNAGFAERYKIQKGMKVNINKTSY